MNSNNLVFLTQVSVVCVGLEEHLWSVYEESEGQKDFNVGSLLKDGGVDVLSVFQLAHANSVVS